MYDTTVPIYFFIRSGYSLTASENEQNIIPYFFNSSLNVVITETLSNTASIAIPDILFCSSNGIPNLLYVSIIFGSNSSRLFNFLNFGAE